MFLTALRREIDLRAKDTFVQNVRFATLYFGGGTPSLLSPERLSGLLSHLLQTFTWDRDIEMSLEANPGAVFKQNLSGYQRAGVNRLTIGIQSFDDNDLKFLQRIHSSADALAALRAARETGFDNLGIDLIFGIPGQTLSSWKKSLANALRERPEHISLYGLTFAENTPLWSQYQMGQVCKCEEELEREMLLTAISMLNDAGYEHYEISNFAQPGFRSKHNQKYWDSSRFLGLGPSAHSFDGVKRWWNFADLTAYTNALYKSELPVAGHELLTRKERLEELVLLGLRRKEGMSLLEWEQHTGMNAEKLIHLLRRRFGGVDGREGFLASPDDFLITRWQNRLCLTQQGILLYNSICENFFNIL